MVEGCVASPATRVNVCRSEVRTADDAGNFPKEEDVVREAAAAADAGTILDAKDGACVVTAVPLRLITEVNDELADWDRGVCLTGADTMVLTGIWAPDGTTAPCADKEALTALRDTGACR